MRRTCTPPAGSAGLGSLGSRDPFTVRPGAVKIRTPVGSSKSNARSPTQNSPRTEPSGGMVTLWACAKEPHGPRTSAHHNRNSHFAFICLPPFVESRALLCASRDVPYHGRRVVFNQDQRHCC